jgi:hypothetical protein
LIVRQATQSAINEKKLNFTTSLTLDNHFATDPRASSKLRSTLVNGSEQLSDNEADSPTKGDGLLLPSHTFKEKLKN